MPPMKLLRNNLNKTFLLIDKYLVYTNTEL